MSLCMCQFFKCMYYMCSFHACGSKTSSRVQSNFSCMAYKSMQNPLHVQEICTADPIHVSCTSYDKFSLLLFGYWSTYCQDCNTQCYTVPTTLKSKRKSTLTNL